MDMTNWTKDDLICCASSQLGVGHRRFSAEKATIMAYLCILSAALDPVDVGRQNRPTVIPACATTLATRTLRPSAMG